MRPGVRVLDIAGGTGDLSRPAGKDAGETGEVVLTDINGSMLRVGRDRLLDEGLMLPVAQCDAEKLPFPDDHFDLVTRRLRPAQHDPQGPGADRDAPRAQARRPPAGAGVLKVGNPLATLYDGYSFKILPPLGELIAGDAESYRYLAESIRMHPDQETLRP